MLILARKEDESIVIGDEIVIKVVSIDRGTVKLGFEAPPRYVILREELKELVANKNKESIVKDVEKKGLDALRKALPHKDIAPNVSMKSLRKLEGKKDD
ncbi:MAG: carbon storage regulator CsrA [Helicobacter sp.]|nr:carbon storage regulator CsrA [Helicobacter sp.]MDE7255471.1 carbon storage regulator CsrA [Helicobacter sp.]